MLIFLSRKKSYYYIKKTGHRCLSDVPSRPNVPFGTGRLAGTQIIMMPNMKLGDDLDKVIDTAGGV
jgi:hypothetical protein